MFRLTWTIGYNLGQESSNSTTYMVHLTVILIWWFGISASITRLMLTTVTCTMSISQVIYTHNYYPVCQTKSLPICSTLQFAKLNVSITWLSLLNTQGRYKILQNIVIPYSWQQLTISVRPLGHNKSIILLVITCNSHGPRSVVFMQYNTMTL